MDRFPTDPTSTHPGEILKKEFLEPRGMTQTELAGRLEVPYQRVNQIVNRRRAITPDTALRLARLFGTTPEFWLDLQLRWDLKEAGHRTKAERAAHERTGAPEVSVETGVLNEIVERLMEAIDPQTIVLFGSSTTGSGGPGSDVDLLVVDRDPFGPHRSRREQLRRARRALSGLRIAKDILLYGPDELERWRDSPNHIIGRALRQGQVLYERS